MEISETSSTLEDVVYIPYKDKLQKTQLIGITEKRRKLRMLENTGHKPQFITRITDIITYDNFPRLMDTNDIKLKCTFSTMILDLPFSPETAEDTLYIGTLEAIVNISSLVFQLHEYVTAVYDLDDSPDAGNEDAEEYILNQKYILSIRFFTYNERQKKLNAHVNRIHKS